MSIQHLDPGERVPVELIADDSGNVADKGDLVEIAGETSNHTQVKLVDTVGAGVAILDRRPEDYDSDTTYASGSTVGTTMAWLRHPVDWLPTSDAYTPTAGDQVVSDVGGGVRAYDSAGGDTPDMLTGRVWGTHQRGTEYTSDKVTVVRHR